MRRIDPSLRVETHQAVGLVDDNVGCTALQTYKPVGQTQGLSRHGRKRCLAARQRNIQSVGNSVDTAAFVEQEDIGGMRSVVSTGCSSAGLHRSL